MEMVTGRGGVRSGRAVVGLDVVSHTLPHNYRAPCCPSTPHDDVCSEPGCADYHPDLCSGHPSLHCTAPYLYHGQTYTPGRWGGCVTCDMALPPPCSCPDPSCVGTSVAAPPCTCSCPPNPGQHSPCQLPDLHNMTRASSDCTLTKLSSVDDDLCTALGYSPDHHTYTLKRHRPSLHNHAFPPPGSRLSRSLENLPKDLKEHIIKCRCSCDHLGYGNFSATSLHQLTDLTNPCSSIKTSSQHNISQDLKHKHKGIDVPAHVWGGMCLVLVLAGVAGVGVSLPLAFTVNPKAALHERLATAKTILKSTPLLDGHNDLPWNIRKFMHNKLHSFNFTAELKKLRPWSRSSWSHTDLPRLREGMVGAQFWVSYVPCESQGLNAVQLTIEQIDLIKRLIHQYPHHLRLATSANEVESAFKDGVIASLIGVEGGHAIQNSLGVLRALPHLGVRYLTLTHTCSTPWAECARAKESDLEDPASPRGLTHFGKTVVREMNRLGLLVDLSHVSQATMRAAITVSRAPVIFSHSSVYAICKNPRNVPDDILKKVAINGGVVMVSFYNHFLTCTGTATISDVVAHINHVKTIAGVDHVGIGADFDGVNKLPEGLRDVSRYPYLFAELLADPSWSLDDLKKLAGQNLLRVMRDAERVRDNMRQQGSVPLEEEVPTSQLPANNNCTYKFNRGTDD